jgi:hypothetical protein
LLLIEIKGGEDIKDVGAENCSDEEGEKEEEERPCFSLSA